MKVPSACLNVTVPVISFLPTGPASFEQEVNVTMPAKRMIDNILNGFMIFIFFIVMN
jgi:hypothetical protein